jgi:hypothetical protein
MGDILLVCGNGRFGLTFSDGEKSRKTGLEEEFDTKKETEEEEQDVKKMSTRMSEMSVREQKTNIQGQSPRESSALEPVEGEMSVRDGRREVCS